MAKNWLDMVTELSAEVKVLRARAPDAMEEFSAMARAASGPEALDSKTKELIALAISVAVRPQADWRHIFDICFENREAEFGRFLRRHLAGRD